MGPIRNSGRSKDAKGAPAESPESGRSGRPWEDGAGCLDSIGTAACWRDGHRHDEPIGSVDGRGSPPDMPGFESEGHRRSSPLLTPARRLGRLPDASRRIVGTGAIFDLLPVDEALDLADNVGTSRIIVHMA